MFNGVLLVAIIATWILKVTSLPKLYYLFFFFVGIDNVDFSSHGSSLIGLPFSSSFVFLHVTCAATCCFGTCAVT